MIDAILRFALERRWLVLCLTLAVAALGAWNYQRLPIDAVPDITNVQVQINTAAPGSSPLEVEQRVTYAIETAMAGLPRLEQTRSLSHYGLSQVTVVFEDGTDIYQARQLINERLQAVKSRLPAGLEPQMGPIATGLGEIFLYTVSADPAARQADGSAYDATALRTIQDWIIRPQLLQVPGVNEVNSIGGFEKQFHVTPNPARLLAYGLSLADIADALERNNASVGAGYIERNGEQYLVRMPGQLGGIGDIRNVVIASRQGVPLRIGDVAEVGLGRQLRTGAATRDGVETVIGTVIMLLGENSRTVSQRVAARLKAIAPSLPAGVHADSVYDRTRLVEETIRTVQTNLGEGALLVVAVLFALLGNIRAALLCAAVIPLAMLFTISGMVGSGISANLMSLGALDFGLIVDGAVIIVENCILRLGQRQQELGRALNRDERFAAVLAATREVFGPSLVCTLVVVLVNLPILALSGVEGKMFRPMASTVILALSGALLFSLSFVPAAVALLLRGPVAQHENALVGAARRIYQPALQWALRRPLPLLGGAALLVLASAWLAASLGREFVPTLDEGDIVAEVKRMPGTSLEQSVSMQQAAEKALLALPQVQTVFTRLGTAEVATDPDPAGFGDLFVIPKPRSAWPNPEQPKDELLGQIEAALNRLPGTHYELAQPIQLRFNDLIAGVRSDAAVKIFGDDLGQLERLGRQIAHVVAPVPGAADVRVEQIAGLPMLSVLPRREALARYGIPVADVQKIVSIALGGQESGQVYEGDRRFDIVVRLPEALRNDVGAIERMPLMLPDGKGYVPLSEVATLKFESGPNEVSRENGKRRVVVSANVRGRDLGSFVAEVQARVQQQVPLPPGYWLGYGGTFEQLQSASARLRLLVPLVLLLIFGLLLLTFGSARDAALVFSSVPLALTGGVAALWLRGIPLSISAGVGFITLSGVAVLTGVVLIAAVRSLRAQGASVHDAVTGAALLRLRPILMIALVASLGFLPMAFNTGAGAEVQRPLATVVIGGIISSTLLTLLVLPALYSRVNRKTSSNET